MAEYMFFLCTKCLVQSLPSLPKKSQKADVVKGLFLPETPMSYCQSEKMVSPGLANSITC